MLHMSAHAGGPNVTTCDHLWSAKSNDPFSLITTLKVERGFDQN